MRLRLSTTADVPLGLSSASGVSQLACTLPGTSCSRGSDLLWLAAFRRARQTRVRRIWLSTITITLRADTEPWFRLASVSDIAGGGFSVGCAQIVSTPKAIHLIRKLRFGGWKTLYRGQITAGRQQSIVDFRMACIECEMWREELSCKRWRESN